MHLSQRTLLLATALLMLPAGARAAEIEILSGPEDALIHGVRGNDSSFRCSLSADGQQVAFESFAHQLVPDDFNQSRDVFVRDRTAGNTIRVSLDALGAEVEAAADYPAISGSGRYVAFSVAADLVGEGPTLFSQAYLYDRASDSLYRYRLDTGELKIELAGEVGNEGTIHEPAIDADGTHLLTSASDALLPAIDRNGQYDVYQVSRTPGEILLGAPVSVDENDGSVTITLERLFGSDGVVRASLTGD